MKLRFSIGIFFSFTLHLFLIIGILRWYPGITNNEFWKLGESIHSFRNNIERSNVSNFERIKFSEKLSHHKIFFPEIVLFRETEKLKKIKKKYDRSNFIEKYTCTS